MRILPLAFLSVAISVLPAASALAQSDPASTPSTQPAAPVLTAAEIVERMQMHNQQRQAALRRYSAERTYHLQYHGVGGREASMSVHLEYQSPGQKEFTVLREDGSKMLCERVLHKAIESEKEAAEQSNRLQTALSPANYTFQLLGIEQTVHGPAYLLQVDPLVDNKFTYHAKVWIDATDFAVVRIAGEPAKNPSWWIKRASFDTRYKKIGDFWLPAENVAVSHIRIGGDARLTILYSAYSNIEAVPLDLELARTQPTR